jgi:hypothetical protein
MTDEQMYRVLNDFAKQHALAEHLEVEIGQMGWSFKPKEGYELAKYEDVQLLSDLVQGAYHLLMWARRRGIVRFRNSTQKRKK